MTGADVLLADLLVQLRLKRDAGDLYWLRGVHAELPHERHDDDDREAAAGRLHYRHDSKHRHRPGAVTSPSAAALHATGASTIRQPLPRRGAIEGRVRCA